MAEVDPAPVVEEGLWRRDPEAFLIDRFPRLIEHGHVEPEAALKAVVMLARLAGLRDPEGIAREAVRRWEQSGGWRRYFARVEGADDGG